MPLGKLYKRNRKLVTVQDGVLINAINPYTGKLYELNKTGSFIWKILIKPKTEKEITREMDKKFEVMEKKLKKDVSGFLKQSIKSKLLI